MDRNDGSFILPNRPSHLANNVSERIQFFQLSIDSNVNYSIEKSIFLYSTRKNL